MTKKIHKGVVHFDIQGEWFTWMLRHLWVEGNEHKAVKIWCDSFSDYSDVESIKGIFLDIVSGRKGFTGHASDENGLTVRDENRKYWDPDQSGKDDKSFPLLQSWEDVLRLKQDKLFIKEVEIKCYRSLRRYGHTAKENNNNAFYRNLGFDENIEDNILIKDFNEIYNSLSDIAKSLGMNPILATLPENNPSFMEIDNKSYKMKAFYKEDTNELFNILNQWRTGEQKYFKNKYGYQMLSLSELGVKHIIGIEEVKDIIHIENDYKYMETKVGGQSTLLDSYVKDLIESGEKESFEPENIKTTKYNNGYIDIQGNFYGCGFVQHLQIDDTIVEFFKLESKTEDSIGNSQRIIEENGWVKVTQKRYYWDLYIHKLTKKQILTISKLMKKWKQEKADFIGLSVIGDRITLDEAVKYNNEEYDLNRRINK